MKAAPKIAANDPRLAHALTRHAVEQEGVALLRRLRASFPSVEQQTVPRLMKAIQRTFGSMLVCTRVRRLHGTRAQADWTALIAAEDGDVIPLFMAFKQQFLDVNFMRFRFTQHAVSRLAQRTIGAADLQRIGPVLGAHLLTVLTFLRDHRDADQHYVRFNTTTADGVFLWRWREQPVGEWTAVTWLDSQNTSDPTVAVNCANVAPGTGTLRVIESVSR